MGSWGLLLGWPVSWDADMTSSFRPLLSSERFRFFLSQVSLRNLVLVPVFFRSPFLSNARFLLLGLPCCIRNGFGVHPATLGTMAYWHLRHSKKKLPSLVNATLFCSNFATNLVLTACRQNFRTHITGVRRQLFF